MIISRLKNVYALKMKKILSTLFMICFFISKSLSQDIITTISGRELKCKIINTDSINVYFTIKKDGNTINTYTSKHDIKNIQYATISKLSTDSIKFHFEKFYLLTIHTGYSFYESKDDVISPFLYSGSSIPINIGYKYFSKNIRRVFSLYYDKVKLQSSITDLPDGLLHYTNNIYVFLESSYNKRIYTSSKSNIDCFLGGKFKSIFNFREHYYSESMTEFNLEQFNSLCLNFLLEKMVLSNKSIININFTMPIITYSIYNNIFNEKAYFNQLINIDNSNINLGHILANGKFITLNKLMELQTEISYAKFINKKIGFDLMYRFDYYSFAQYKQLLYSKYLTSQLLIGLTYKII